MPRNFRHHKRPQLGRIPMQRGKPTVYTVVAIDKDVLSNLGSFNGLEQAKEIADRESIDTRFCIVYSEDNLVIYSTER